MRFPKTTCRHEAVKRCYASVGIAAPYFTDNTPQALNNFSIFSETVLSYGTYALVGIAASYFADNIYHSVR